MHRFKPCSRRVENKARLAGNKVKRLSPVNHTTKTIQFIKVHPSLAKVPRRRIMWSAYGELALSFSTKLETYGWWNCTMQTILSMKICVTLFIEDISALPFDYLQVHFHPSIFWTKSLSGFLSNTIRFSCLDWNRFLIISPEKICNTMRYSNIFTNIKISLEFDAVSRKYNGMITVDIRNYVYLWRRFCFFNFNHINFCIF